MYNVLGVRIHVQVPARQELDRLLGVPEGRPRGVVLSYRPTKVFQSLVEKALSLTTGTKGDDDLQLLLSCVWNLCFKASEGRPSHLLPEVTLRRAEGDRLAWNRLREGLLLSPCVVSRWRHWKPGKVSEHTVVNQSSRGASGRNGESASLPSFSRLPTRFLTWRL